MDEQAIHTEAVLKELTTLLKRKLERYGVCVLQTLHPYQTYTIGHRIFTAIANLELRSANRPVVLVDAELDHGRLRSAIILNVYRDDREIPQYRFYDLNDPGCFDELVVLLKKWARKTWMHAPQPKNP